MKRFFLITLGLSLGLNTFAGLPQSKLNTKIDAVTVFLNGAQISRSGSLVLEPGLREILITGLSTGINFSSVQVGGTGDFTLLSVSPQINYLEQQKQSKEISLLKDSVKLLQSQLDLEQAMLQVYKQEETMLLSNQAIGGQEKGVDPQQLMIAVDYFRKRMTEVKKLQLEVQKKIRDLSQSIQRINSQLAGMAGASQPVGEIVLLVQVDSKTTAALKISYSVDNASWIPTYDIRVKDTKSPPTLNYKAIVQQLTGEDWNNVKLTLSTADPNQNSTIPYLNPWYLTFQRPIKTMLRSQTLTTQEFDNAPAPSAAETQGKIMKGDARQMGGAAAYTVSYDTEINVEYQISIPYSIESDGKEFTIEVATYTLEATYTYYCVPKLDKEAFLKARVTGWEKYDILPAHSNIFFEGTLVGTAVINARYAEDTLDISLGRDKRIIVERNSVKDVSNKAVIGASKKETHIYEIKIRNNKKEDISIVIEDQIPISKTTEIEVTKLDDSGARYNAETGKLTWEFRMAAAESKSIRFGFTVKYPKDQILYIR